jgi:abequosyltransferase
MKSVRLSVCIPVHNFGAFVGPTLESIIGQASDEVEIVVLDGGSTDGTAEIIGRYQELFPRLTYQRLDRRGGIDRDMARAVALARGEYCWLFSGDDLMRPGAVRRVLGELDERCDVYLLEAMLCDFDMRPMATHKMLDLASPRTFRLGDPGDRLEYFELSLNTAAFFSFCSSLVIRKARWDATAIDDAFYGSCWAHAARIMSMIPAGLTVRYLPEPFLDKRGDNDSFLTQGMTARFGIAVDGYHAMADAFFGHASREAFLIRRALRSELSRDAWIHAKFEMEEAGRTEQFALFRRLARKQFSDHSLANWLARAACLAPLPVLRAIRRLLAAYRRLRALLPERRAVPRRRPPDPTGGSRADASK